MDTPVKRLSMTRPVPRVAWRIWSCGLCVAILAGCGGGGAAPAPSAAPPPSQQQASPAATAPTAAPVAAAPASRSTATRWIGGIPYDVFYDRPLEVAADQTLLAATTTAPAAAPSVPTTPPTTPATPAPAPPPTPTPTAAPSGGGIDWGRAAAIEQIVDEITSLRNDLSQKLSQLSTYNSSWEMIGVEATTLAALAGVVELHPGEVSWKANAKLARTLAAQVNANASKTGRSAYDATKAPFDLLVDLFSGNPPAGVQAEEQAPFADYADRGVLMKRIELTLNGLKSNINTEARMKEDPAAVKRKLAMLATLMSVVATPSYDYTDETDYQQFAGGFITAAVAGREAVDANDFNGFSASLDRMKTLCGECHQKYAFGN